MAFTEFFTNRGSCTLTAGYTAGAGSITVSSTTGDDANYPFPVSVPFRLSVWTASSQTFKVILQVTAITDGTHFAVTAEGHDANAASGDTCYGVQTAASLTAIRGDAANLANATGLLPLANLLLPPVCSGRLTTESGVPVSTSDRTAQGTIYFTPYLGSAVSLYDGSNWAAYSFTERSLALTVTSGKNYDVFLYNNSGTLTLELSAAWSGDNARTDALTTQDGVYVKSGATTRRYIGTIRASGTNQTSDSGGGTTTQVGGQRYVWNYYNRVNRWLSVFDSTDSWAYTTATWRQANGATGNKVELVIGQPEDSISAALSVGIKNDASNQNGAISIGLDSTTTPSLFKSHLGASTTNISGVVSVAYSSIPTTAGYHSLNWLEFSQGSTVTFFGDAGVTYIQSGLAAMIRN